LALADDFGAQVPDIIVRQEEEKSTHSFTNNANEWGTLKRISDSLGAAPPLSGPPVL